MKKLLILLSIVMLSSVAWAGQIEFKTMKFNSMGMSGRMIRLNDNGIFLDDAGFHLEGTLTMKITGMRGQRLICILSPVDPEGNMMADRRGDLSNLTAFTHHQLQRVARQRECHQGLHRLRRRLARPDRYQQHHQCPHRHSDRH